MFRALSLPAATAAALAAVPPRLVLPRSMARPLPALPPAAPSPRCRRLIAVAAIARCAARLVQARRCPVIAEKLARHPGARLRCLRYLVQLVLHGT